MHITIPVTDEVLDSLGSPYVLYSVYLEGFLLFKVRYSVLHLWDEQLHRAFGNRLPTFPPKYYLAMTKSMAEERRGLLEKYLQILVSDPVVSGSEIFMNFFKTMQLETFKIPIVKIILKVYLPDGSQVKVNVHTSDPAERVLEVALYNVGLSRELREYFSLYITKTEHQSDITVVKQIADFELPFITIYNMDGDTFQIDIRKWYMDPVTDRMLFGCTSGINLLYMQAVQELEMNWSRPTEEQRQKLRFLLDQQHKMQFLELMQKVDHYGHLKLRPCTSDFPHSGTPVTVSVGYSEMSCCFQPPNGKTEIIRLHVNDLLYWTVQMLVSKNEDPASDNKNELEFKFEYLQGEVPKCISIQTSQAFLLSTCLKKILCEQPVASTKEHLEIQKVEAPGGRADIRVTVELLLLGEYIYSKGL
ncbi:sorting nexin-31 [Pelodytes ibericus]